MQLRDEGRLCHPSPDSCSSPRLSPLSHPRTPRAERRRRHKLGGNQRHLPLAPITRTNPAIHTAQPGTQHSSAELLHPSPLSLCTVCTGPFRSSRSCSTIPHCPPPQPLSSLTLSHTTAHSTTVSPVYLTQPQSSRPTSVSLAHAAAAASSSHNTPTTAPSALFNPPLSLPFHLLPSSSLYSLLAVPRCRQLPAVSDFALSTTCEAARPLPLPLPRPPSPLLDGSPSAPSTPPT